MVLLWSLWFLHAGYADVIMTLFSIFGITENVYEYIGKLMFSVGSRSPPDLDSSSASSSNLTEEDNIESISAERGKLVGKLI